MYFLSLYGPLNARGVNIWHGCKQERTGQNQ
jgi:hypothetical protein